MANHSLIRVIEAAYVLEGDDSEWLAGLARASDPVIGRGLGAVAVLYDASRPDYVDLKGFGVMNMSPEILSAAFNVPESTESQRRVLVGVFRERQVGTLRRVFRHIPEGMGPVRQLEAAGYPDGDMFGITVPDPSNHGVLLLAFSDQAWNVHPRTAARWLRVAAHIATGLRIRHRLRALNEKLLESPGSEAIFEAGGRVAHATGEATSLEARDGLRAAVAAFERARRDATDPDEALMLWEALVDGRWSLLDCFDRDGRRYWVAHRNEPDVVELNPLSTRESWVAAHAALGQSNKLIAYELGLSLSTVARDLRSAMAKLGVRTRPELVRAWTKAC